MSIREDTEEYRKALLEKAMILGRMQRYKEALPLFEKLIGMTNVNVEKLSRAYLFKGECCMFLKMFDKAVDSYKKAIEINSSDPRVKERCSDALYSLKG